jgi:SAM-dependent methyltransferase
MIRGAMPDFPDHFSALANGYATFRPSYPADFVASVAALAPSLALAWDCATGNGQAALLLADHFERVVATDASAPQIALAKPHPRVDYRVALAERSGLADRSVDLITIAQALHWFDLPRAWTEMERVLKPRGVVAAWCYPLAQIDRKIGPVVWKFYEGRVGRFWPPERKHVEVDYRDFDFPFDELDGGTWSMEATLTRKRFLGYVATWSAVKQAREQLQADPLPELARALESVWPANETREVRWPMGLRVGRKRDA